MQSSLAGQGGSHLEVIEVQPATTYYTTRVQKVSNTAKYPKYAPPTVRTQVQHVLPPVSPTVLKGQVGADDNLDDGINRGVGAAASTLLKQAPTVDRVKPVHLTADVFRNWIKQNWPKLSVGDLKAPVTGVKTFAGRRQIKLPLGILSAVPSRQAPRTVIAGPGL